MCTSFLIVGGTGTLKEPNPHLKKRVGPCFAINI